MTSPRETPAELHTRTTIHVRRAIDGDREGLAYVVNRFSPVLVAQASYRLGRILKDKYDAEDIVHDAWVVVLGRLPELRPRDGRYTPVLLKFLSSTIVHRVGNLLKKHVRGEGLDLRPRANSQVDDPPAETSGIIRSLTRREVAGAIHDALEQLDEKDREVILLRGIEQQTNDTTATILGLTPSATTMRYKRALERLRKQLPGSIFDELED